MRHIIIAISAIFFFQQSLAQRMPSNYLKARSHMLTENYDSSLYYFNKAVKENRDDYDAIFYRGISYYKLNLFPSANKDFRQVNNRYNGKASLMLAKTELRLNHPEVAINFLREHLSSYYKIAEKDILLDPELSALEGTSAWNNLWREKEWYNHLDNQLQEVRYLMSSGDDLEALNILSNLEKRGSKATLVHQYKSEIYLRNGNEKAALDELSKSVKTDYRNLDARKLRASLYIGREDFTNALNDYKIILRQDPSLFEYYILSAKLMSELNDYKGALNEIGIYQMLFPSNDNAYFEEGNIHFAHGKYLNALTCYNKALALNEGIAEYYYARGISYAATGTHLYAVKDFSMSLDLDPLSADTWFAKGLTDMALGDNSAACFDFRKAAQYGIFEARSYVGKLCK